MNIKSIFGISVLLLLLISGCCKEERKTLDPAIDSWLPYQKGDIVTFDDQAGTYDTLQVLSYRRYEESLGEHCGKALEWEERIEVVLAPVSDTSKYMFFYTEGSTILKLGSMAAPGRVLREYPFEKTFNYPMEFLYFPIPGDEVFSTFDLGNHTYGSGFMARWDSLRFPHFTNIYVARDHGIVGYMDRDSVEWVRR